MKKILMLGEVELHHNITSITYLIIDCKSYI